MLPTKSDVLAVLRSMNPWWTGSRATDLPTWRRASFLGIQAWLDGPSKRALLLTGARQVGKTTLFLQTIDALLDRKSPPVNILYATFDHPLLKLTGIDNLLNLWREFEPRAEGDEFLFLDEIQATRDWQTWLKHQVDFEKRRRIAVTGSSTPLTAEGQESGVGRWETLDIATLSFSEYLQIRKTPVPQIPVLESLDELAEWTPAQFVKVGDAARPLVGHFHEYLVRGGFPQCALEDSISRAQKLLREDIVDRVLKRDMTALYGVRRIVELELLFLYLCLHGGGILDLVQLTKNLQVNKPLVNNYLDILEASHLIRRLRPFGYGKEVLRGKSKVYLADPAIGPSVLLKGKSLLEDGVALGAAVETAVVHHLTTHYGARGAAFSYWRDARGEELDAIVETEGRVIPFEVKYRSQTTEASEVKALSRFCSGRHVNTAFVLTRELTDFGLMESGAATSGAFKVAKVPALLACWWLR